MGRFYQVTRADDDVDDTDEGEGVLSGRGLLEE